MTSTVPSTTNRPTLRRLPTPACEPPYDDELDGPTVGRAAWSRAAAEAGGAVQGTLALAFVLPTGVPAVPVAPIGLRLVPPAAPAAPAPQPRPDALEELDEVDFGPQPTSRADLPEPRTWAARLVQALVEVLAGDRPVGQLVRWTSAAVYDNVSALARPGDRGTSAAARGVVRSVHVSEPIDGVAEVAALVRRGRRTTAVALRLEGLDGRWQCTAVELG
ncbi:MAG: Rv3235 family protein [Spirochaetaceae bacterium]|nr:Rv3235 family protein [Spirochaetaceae bacterium]